MHSARLEKAFEEEIEYQPVRTHSHFVELNNNMEDILLDEIDAEAGAAKNNSDDDELLI
jgi:hypothetical protein